MSLLFHDLSCLGLRHHAPVVPPSAPALSSDSDKEGEDEGTEEEELPALPTLGKNTKKELGLWQLGIKQTGTSWCGD